ncbi:restriction endonuclease subunit S [Vibrio vulnificus]|uniref:restriction endonuclease subunit S n=1 Tax=Vibrio vulnificus TaxID=672 RepID=UPI003ED85A40
MSWPLVKFGSFCSVVTKGTTPTSIGYDFSEEGIPFLRVQNIKNSTVCLDDVLFVDQNTHDALERSKVKAGDLLVTIAGTIGRVAVVPEAFPEANCNQAVAIIRFDKSKFDIRFLLHWLSSDEAIRQISGKKVTGTISNLSLSQIKELEIPLPPLDEQKRIAAILDKADAIRQKRKQAIALSDEFLRSVFLEMFGDPVTNPKGWEVKEIRKGISKIISGWSAKGDSRPCEQDEVGVLKISAVTSGEFKPKENKVVEKNTIPQGKKLIFPKKGDLLFSRANTRELVAATCIVPKDCDDVFLPDKLWNIELTSDELLPEYFHMLLQDAKFKETLTAQATGSSGSMLNISKQKFETTLAPFAPKDLQEKFRDIYWQLKENETKLKSSEEQLINQFEALSQKAFSGQL